MRAALLPLLVAAVLPLRAAEPVWRNLATPVQPPVEMASDGASLALRVPPLGDAAPAATLAAWRARGATARLARFPGRVDVSEKALGPGPLRLWLHVRWTDPAGAVVRRETYLSPGLGDREPKSPEGMELFDLAAFVRESRAEASRIRIPVDMPRDGKATVVLDDAGGRRVRNLASALPLPAGRTLLEWDGRREDGTLAAPGSYRVRVATHDGLSYELLPTFGNGGETNLWAPYGPNHTAFRSLVAHDGLVSASSYFTEGGNSTDVFDASGALLHGWGEIWTLGNEALFHADGAGDFFYSVREARRDDPDRPGGKLSVLQCFGYRWSGRHRPEVRVRTPDAARIPGERSALRIAPFPAPDAPPSLAGAAFLDGRLYVSDRLAGGLAVHPLDERPAENRTDVLPRERLLPLADPGPVCRSLAGGLVVASGRDLFALAAGPDAPLVPLCSLPAAPVALAARKGEVFALLPGSHQIHVFDPATGAELRRIGEPGGPYRGPWRPDRLVNPTAICLSSDGSALWVTEERMSPKRLSRWDPATGHCVYEKLGSESYGSPGAGMDPDDPDHWIAQDCEWRLDPTTGAGRVVAVLHPETREGDGSWNGAPIANRTYRWVRRDGRTFVIGNDAQTTLYEYRDHRLVPLAMVTTPGIFSYHLDGRRRLCEPVLRAYMNAFHEQNRDRPVHDETTLMLWLDRNGNERIDEEELSFADREADAGIGFWGAFVSDLDFAIPVSRKGGVELLRFRAGDLSRPGSLPAWSIEKAWAERVRCPDPLPAGSSPPHHCESASAADGHALSLGAAPHLLAYGPDGRLAWHMKNPFPNVHGSHAAPLPVPGELQGVLFALGSVPIPGGLELLAIQGNHGRVFFVTSDGLFLDELFTDCRVSERADETCVGGEAFGGSFQMDRVHRVPVLQAGAGGYRHYRILGTGSVRVSSSSLAVSAADLEAAERLHPAVPASERAAPAATLPRLDDPAAPLPRLAEWSSGNWHVSLSGAWDAARLRLRYSVEEPSPWVNNGDDPFLAFKTGDCVDLQLGTPGLLRLLVAPAPGGDPSKPPVAVLYRHRIPASEKPSAHPRDFNSPSRRYTVDDAVLADDVVATARRDNPGHYTVDVAVPLARLGLDPATLAGTSIPADFGVVFGDRDGTVNLSRVYWANKETGLVNDVPGEMIPAPSHWGTLRFAPAAATDASGPAAAAAAAPAPPPRPGKLVFSGFLGSAGGTPLAAPVERYGAGPEFDPARGLLYASAGDGFVAATRLDGTRAALHPLPGAPPFSRFDSLALARDGSLFVLAGGSVTADERDERGGVLYRIPAGAAPDAPAERLDAVGPVNALSRSEHDGALVLHQRRRELVALDTATLRTRPLGAFQAGGGLYLVNFLDWDPAGALRWGYDHRFVHALPGDGGAPAAPRRIFGPREISMDHARFLGPHLWTLQSDTVKRFDALTYAPDPGVVHGGTSGAFLGSVARNHEMELSGICSLGDNLYAVLSARNAALYVLRWNGATRHLDELRRIGPVPAAPSLLLDDAGAVFADGLVWHVGDAPLAPPRATTHARGTFGAALLPDGTAVLLDREGDRVAFRRGSLAGAAFGDADGRVPAGEGAGPFAGATVRPVRDGFVLTRYDAAGRGVRFALDPSGRVREGEGASPADEPPPVPAGLRADAWAVDDGRIALVDAAAGTLRVADVASGSVLAAIDGLSRPDRVAFRAGRVLVHEAGAQRLSSWKLVLP